MEIAKPICDDFETESCVEKVFIPLDSVVKDFQSTLFLIRSTRRAPSSGDSNRSAHSHISMRLVLLVLSLHAVRQLKHV